MKKISILLSLVTLVLVSSCAKSIAGNQVTFKPPGWSQVCDNNYKEKFATVEINNAVEQHQTINEAIAGYGFDVGITVPIISYSYHYLGGDYETIFCPYYNLLKEQEVEFVIYKPSRLSKQLYKVDNTLSLSAFRGRCFRFSDRC